MFLLQEVHSRFVVFVVVVRRLFVLLSLLKLMVFDELVRSRTNGPVFSLLQREFIDGLFARDFFIGLQDFSPSVESCELMLNLTLPVLFDLVDAPIILLRFAQNVTLQMVEVALSLACLEIHLVLQILPSFQPLGLVANSSEVTFLRLL